MSSEKIVGKGLAPIVSVVLSLPFLMVSPHTLIEIRKQAKEAIQ
jgi:hypothetical protein